ncbi:MAG: hypothetical protein ACXWR1_12990 [Bdellovibrionota bacterium]
MKTSLAFLAACLFIALNLPARAAQGGGDEGPHGGDDVALEFVQSFASAVSTAQVSSPALYQAIKSNDLASLLKLETVLVLEQSLFVQKDGYQQESAVVNDPDSGKILINRPRWQNIKNLRIREAIALHEVASLRGLEDTGRYALSAEYVSLFGLSQADLEGADYYPPPPPPPAFEGALRCRASADYRVRTFLDDESRELLTNAFCAPLVPDSQQCCLKPDSSILDSTTPETWLASLNQAFAKKGIYSISLKEITDPRSLSGELCGFRGAIRDGAPATPACLYEAVEGIFRHRICGMDWDRCSSCRVSSSPHSR